MKRPKHVVDTVDTPCTICANTVVFWLINTHFMILYWTNTTGTTQLKILIKVYLPSALNNTFNSMLENQLSIGHFS